MERRSHRRKKQRIPCDLVVGSRRVSGLVLDLSPNGLFVQTSTKLEPGAEALVRLRLGGVRRDVELRAVVARHKAVPAMLSRTAKPGVGLRIVWAPEAYFEAVVATRAGLGLPDAAGAEAPGEALRRFRVRLKQTDGPRSRTLEVPAPSPGDAATRALAELGRGWEVLATEAA